MNSKLNLVYTDGSQPFNVKDTIYYGYHIIDSDEKEYTYKTKICKSEYDKIFVTDTNLDSTHAEFLGILVFLQHLYNSNYIDNQTYHIFTDSQNAFQQFTGISKRSGKNHRPIISKCKSLLKLLSDKQCKIDFLWIESHKENWGNLHIDNELNKYRGGKKIISVDKKAEFRLKQILVEDLIESKYNITFDNFLKKLQKNKSYNFKGRQRLYGDMIYFLSISISNDRKTVVDFLDKVLL